MASAIDAHLRDLESEAFEAEKEADEFRERSYQRIEQLKSPVTSQRSKPRRKHSKNA